jgi:uncharacterized protein
MMNLPLFCSGLLIALFALLSLNVSLTRIRQRKDKTISDADLHRAVRAHGNAAEYVPLFIAVFLYFSVWNAGYALAAIAVVATVSRYAHAAGMLYGGQDGKRNPLRYYGAIGTYLSLFAAAVAILLRAV